MTSPSSEVSFPRASATSQNTALCWKPVIQYMSLLGTQCPEHNIFLSWRFTQHHRPVWECSTYAWCPIWGKFLKDSAYKIWVCKDLEAQAPATYGTSKFQSARGSCVLGGSHYPGFISEKDPDKRQLNENRSFSTYNSLLVYYFREVMAET